MLFPKCATVLWVPASCKQKVQHYMTWNMHNHFWSECKYYRGSLSEKRSKVDIASLLLLIHSSFSPEFTYGSIKIPPEADLWIVEDALHI